MKMSSSRYQLEMRAEAALKAALGEISTVKVREIRCEPSRLGCDSNLMVHVDLFGQRHTLSCEIHSDGEPQQLRSTLEGMRSNVNHEAMPIIVAPYLSPEAQALCKENMTGFVDLEGNVRLALGEIFIVKRTLPHRGPQQSVAAAQWHAASKPKSTSRSIAARHAVMQTVVA